MTDPIASAENRREHDAKTAAPTSGLLGHKTGGTAKFTTYKPHTGKTSLDLGTGERN
jgi:hypothetical protein